MTSKAKPTTFREWMLDTLKPDTIRDLAEYGAAGGFPGLTYYSDTCALYEVYEDEIWESLWEQAEGFGHAHPLELIASFGDAKGVATDTQFKNLLVWYLAEETARQLVEEEFPRPDEDIGDFLEQEDERSMT